MSCAIYTSKGRVADAISLLMIVPYVAFLYYDPRMFVVLICCTITVLMFQSYTPSSEFPFKRPDGACNCDILNLKGSYSGKSGFPSGHMASVACALAIVGLRMVPARLQTRYAVLFALPLIAAMGWARIEKRCHDLQQVVFGTLYGGLFAFTFTSRLFS
jgi:membrane-associated phospholipid phosphatase